MEISYLITAFVMIIVAVILYIVFFGSEEDFHNYVEDKLYEVPWRWEWKKELIVNLKCHCPKCDETLVYENDFILHKDNTLEKYSADGSVKQAFVFKESGTEVTQYNQRRRSVLVTTFVENVNGDFEAAHSKVVRNKKLRKEMR